MSEHADINSNYAVSAWRHVPSPMSDHGDMLKARLYAALKHEKSCSCGECSGGLNAVDDVFAAIALAEAERDEAREQLLEQWNGDVAIGRLALRAEAAEARVAELEANYKRNLRLATAEIRAERDEARKAFRVVDQSLRTAVERMGEVEVMREDNFVYMQEALARVEAAEAELAEIKATVLIELEALERWAGEQNAGNDFADQVRMWALSKSAALAKEGGEG